MILSAVHGLEDYTLCVTDCVFEEMVQSRLDCADYGIIYFSMPRDMKIDFAVDVFWHGEDSLVRPLKQPVRLFGASETSRTTAGLIALRASPMNRADQRPTQLTSTTLSALFAHS